MWQRRKLSTNEALSEAGPLPSNWGSIFGLEGIKDRIGDLSWVGPYYADMGWVELTSAEQEAVRLAQVLARVSEEQEVASAALSDVALTVDGKAAWLNFLLALDLVPLQVPVTETPNFPARPVNA
jgi:hypothetical protein|tara:strand:- start:320 stop:694 length:375 start_codon:yes stop_codon:yes gene_type:complete